MVSKGQTGAQAGADAASAAHVAGPERIVDAASGPGRVSPDEGMANIVQAAGAQAAALALLNAVQHLQRTATLVEAATAVTLSNALAPGAEAKGWTDGLEASRVAMAQAIEAFQVISDAAGRLARR